MLIVRSGEGRHALAGRHGERAAQRRPRRIAGERDGHGVGSAVVTTLPYASSIEACRPKAVLTLTVAGGCCVITNCVAAAGVTVMALVTPWPKPLAGDHERVAGRGLGQRQSGEGGHAARRGHGQRAAERGAAGVVRQRHASPCR